jgi:GrpB-like predicted nucleotidyltransferase (UPF0157 family)
MTSRHAQPIVITDYDAAWPARFEAERDRIYEACGRAPFAAIEHVGSTSVPGLAAKPVIDILAGLHDLGEAAALIPKIEGLGYDYKQWTERPSPELNDPGTPFRRYFSRDVDGVRAYQIHMVEITHDRWERTLLFRDYLRRHAESAADYAALKRRLAARYNDNITPESNINVGYTNYKTEFVEDCLRKARAEPATGG